MTLGNECIFTADAKIMLRRCGQPARVKGQSKGYKSATSDRPMSKRHLT